MNVLGSDISVGEKLVRSVMGGERSPTLLVRHGRVPRRNLRRERPRPRDLRAAPRHHGMVSVRDIRYAFLEGDGHVSVIAGRPRGE